MKHLRPARPCALGATHYAGCACHESAWAEKLAAVTAECEQLAERLAMAEAASRPVFSRRMLEEKLAAAEARIRGLEEALRNAVEMIHDANGPLEYAKANDWMRGQLLALQTPPPEAEKRGGRK